jgi:membrane-associated phospholipid phosphatase
MPTQEDRARTRWVPLIVGVAALASFVILRFIVPGPGDDPLPIDKWWHDSMLTDRTPIGVAIAWIPGWVAGTLGTIVTGLVLVATFLLLRRKWDALTVAIAMVVAIAIAAPVAAIVGRIRPKDSLAESVPTSFPSGHTALAATITVVIALLVRRWWAWLIAVVWIVFVGWSRTYLEAHWLTDIIAGVLLGIGAALVVWFVMETIRLRRHAPVQSGDDAATGEGTAATPESAAAGE